MDAIEFYSQYVSDVDGLYCIIDGSMFHRFNYGNDEAVFCPTCMSVLAIETDEGREEQVLEGLCQLLRDCALMH